MPHIGLTELLVILVIILLLFGASQLPKLARGLGRSIHEFKQGASSESETAQPPTPSKDQATAEKPRGSS